MNEIVGLRPNSKEFRKYFLTHYPQEIEVTTEGKLEIQKSKVVVEDKIRHGSGYFVSKNSREMSWEDYVETQVRAREALFHFEKLRIAREQRNEPRN